MGTCLFLATRVQFSSQFNLNEYQSSHSVHIQDYFQCKCTKPISTHSWTRTHTRTRVPKIGTQTRTRILILVPVYPTWDPYPYPYPFLVPNYNSVLGLKALALIPLQSDNYEKKNIRVVFSTRFLLNANLVFKILHRNLH